MPELSSEPPAPQDAIGDSSREADLWRYRRTCQEVDRLLDQGRLSEAISVNMEARELFRRLFSSVPPK